MVGALIGLFCGLLLAELLIQWRAVRVVLALVENSPPFRVESLPPDADAELFQSTASDGLMIRGSIYRHTDRAARGLIVFCHEYGSNHWSAMMYSSALWDAGFDVLAFDFRNLGDSDKLPGYEPLHWLTHYEVSDLVAVLDYLQRRPDLREMPLGLFGISRGGCAALYAAAIRPEVRCVATEGSFATRLMMLAHARRWISLIIPERLADLIPWWHVDLTMRLTLWVSQWRRRCRYAHLERMLPKLSDKPVLMIAGERDTYVLPAVPAEMCRLTGRPDSLWIVPQAKHNLARLADADQYDRRLTQFFLAALTDGDESQESEASRAARREVDDMPMAKTIPLAAMRPPDRPAAAGS